MERFRADALAIGCLVGFKHFSTSTRGREELLVTVRNYEIGELNAQRLRR